MNLSPELVCAIFSFLPRTPSLHINPSYALHSLFDTGCYVKKYNIVVQHLDALFAKTAARNVRIKALSNSIYAEECVHYVDSVEDKKKTKERLTVARMLHDATYFSYRAALCSYMMFLPSPKLSRDLENINVIPFPH